jgi:hypothetical protein
MAVSSPADREYIIPALFLLSTIVDQLGNWGLVKRGDGGTVGGVEEEQIYDY